MGRVIARFVAVFAIGCSGSPTFTERLSVTTPLTAGFNSYASLAEVKRGIIAGLPITVIEDSQLPPGDQRPPFNILTLSVPFTHLEQRGELQIKFFNDRLKSTWFYPQNMQRYVEMLNHTEVKFGPDGSCLIAPYTRITKGKDYRDREYVRWEDVRLQKESNEWIKRHS